MATPEQIWADADLSTRRLAGLALNPSVPESVLLRLLGEAPLAARMVLCRDRALPDAVVDAVIQHPDARTRSFFARNPHADPAQRVRLVDDSAWSVRAHLADGPRVAAPARPRPLPDEAVVHMISTYEDELLGGPFYQQISAGLRRSMATHPVANVRHWGVGEWRSLAPDTRAALLADPDAGVREAAERHVRCEDPTWVESTLPDRPCHARTDLLLHRPLTRAVVEGVLARPAGEEDKAMIAVNPTLPPDTVVLLAADPDPEVRARIAQRTDLGPAERRTLMSDPDPDVRLAVSLHPALSEEERARIDYQVPMDHFFVYLPAPEAPGTLGPSGATHSPATRCCVGGRPATICCHRTSSHAWPRTTTSAYASCWHRTTRTPPHHFCCAVSSSTPVPSAATSPPGRSSPPTDWLLSPTTKTPKSGPWPPAPPKPGRQPWLGSPGTRTLP